MLDLGLGSFVHLVVDLVVCALVIAVVVGAKHGLKMAWSAYRDSLPTKYCLRFLSAEQKQVLTQALVPFELTFNDRNDESVLIEASQLKKVKRLLNAAVVHEFDLGHRQHELILHFAHPYDPALRRLRVTVDSNVRSQKSNLASAVHDILLPVVRKNISVHGQPGVREPIRDQNFHVFLFSAPRNVGMIQQPATAWYAPTTRGSRLMITAGQGLPLVDETTGSIVGELVDNCLYLHGDIWEDTVDRALTWRQRLYRFFKWTGGKNPRLGLLVRVLQKVKDELHANQCLEELIAKLKHESSATGAANNAGKQVFVSGFIGSPAAVYNSLLRDILLPVTGQDIRVNSCRGTARNPVANNVFNIFAYSSPEGAPILETPETLFGCRLFKREKAFAPSVCGVPIVDESGFVVAELLNQQNLYLHCDYLQYGTRSEATLLAKLLIAVRKELIGLANLTEAELDARLVEQMQSQCAKSCAVAAVAVATDAQVQLAETDYSAQLGRTAFAQSEYFRVEEAPGEVLGREFDALASIGKVVRVDMSGPFLKVFTKTLYCTDPRTGVLHEIGAFEINIPTDLSNHVIWDNKTRKVSSGGGSAMNAPHVGASGHACLGNMKEVFSALISKRDFAAAVEAAIAFVESVNVNDVWGAGIHHWPAART